MANFYFNPATKQYFEVAPDYDSESPREWGTPSKFFTWERNYLSPDQHEDEFDTWENMADFFEADLGFENEKEDVEKLIEAADKKGYVLSPVYKYEHSGRCYRTKPFGCKWDSGLVGIIFIDREIARTEMFFQNDAVVRSRLEEEVEQYSRWVNGEDIYSCRLYDCCGEEMDSIYSEWLNQAHNESIEGLVARCYNDYFCNVEGSEIEAENLEDLGEFNSIGEAIFYHEKAANSKNKGLGR